MKPPVRVLLVYSLSMLAVGLVFGITAAVTFEWPVVGQVVRFTQSRSLHTSAVLFWIIGGGIAATIAFAGEVFPSGLNARLLRWFVTLWIVATSSALMSFAFGVYGGREYWDFHPALGLPFGIAFALLVAVFWRPRLRFQGEAPAYLLMWTTGILFLAIAFLEQNLYLVPSFGASFMRDIVSQWKSNGSMVGAWNQLLYGCSLFLMVKVSGDASIASGTRAFLFWVLGFANLLFNWGHHFYNLPTNDWVRQISYVVSMTEWIIFLDVLRSFRRKDVGSPTQSHPVVRGFLRSAEYWVAVNLLLALLISIPAVNRFTHGTHITVAHAMGTTIGINTMILFAAFAYLSSADSATEVEVRRLTSSHRVAMLGLGVMFIALLWAGISKALLSPPFGPGDFAEVSKAVVSAMRFLTLGGLILAAGLFRIAWIHLLRLTRPGAVV